ESSASSARDAPRAPFGGAAYDVSDRGPGGAPDRGGLLFNDRNGLLFHDRSQFRSKGAGPQGRAPDLDAEPCPRRPRARKRLRSLSDQSPLHGAPLSLLRPDDVGEDLVPAAEVTLVG